MNFVICRSKFNFRYSQNPFLRDNLLNHCDIYIKLDVLVLQNSKLLINFQVFSYVALIASIEKATII